MKKIINGKLYNTETAIEIGVWSNGHNYSDFQWCEETLYKTKNGKYFIFGEGGPLSPYTETCGNNNWCGSSEITPLTDVEAASWAEKNLTADEFIEAFGNVEEA